MKLNPLNRYFELVKFLRSCGLGMKEACYQASANPALLPSCADDAQDVQWPSADELRETDQERASKGRGGKDAPPEGYNTLAGFLRLNGMGFGPKQISLARKLAFWAAENGKDFITNPGTRPNFYKVEDLQEFMATEANREDEPKKEKGKPGRPAKRRDAAPVVPESERFDPDISHHKIAGLIPDEGISMEELYAKADEEYGANRVTVDRNMRIIMLTRRMNWNEDKSGVVPAPAPVDA